MASPVKSGLYPEFRDKYDSCRLFFKMRHLSIFFPCFSLGKYEPDLGFIAGVENVLLSLRAAGMSYIQGTIICRQGYVCIDVSHCRTNA